jgi:DNA-binding transcriptional MerR regulator
VFGLALGLIVRSSAPQFHENHPTPSSALEVKMVDRYLTIGELAKRTGVATSALRYYEQLGLIPAPVRVSGQRRYLESAVRLVGVILLLQDVGFSLRESKAFLASRTCPNFTNLIAARLAGQHVVPEPSAPNIRQSRPAPPLPDSPHRRMARRRDPAAAKPQALTSPIHKRPT